MELREYIEAGERAAGGRKALAEIIGLTHANQLTNAKAGLEKKATTKPATVKKTTAEKKVVVAKASAKLKAGKKKVTIKIKKASVSGYQIKYASNKNFKKAKTRNTRKTIYTIKSLRSKKKCYVKVRAYKIVKGKKIYGSYSKVLKVTVK